MAGGVVGAGEGDRIINRFMMRFSKSFFSSNPYGHLLRTAWHYAAGRRGQYIFIYTLFTAVNLVTSFQPIIFGYYVNYLQTGEGDLLRGTLIYAAVYLGITLLSWAFQWPARLLERRLAFDIAERLLMETYDRVVHLPLSWHREHHSGDTINRTRKAYEALKNFFDGGFTYFQTIARMVIALVAILAFSPLFGIIASTAGMIILSLVLAFDGPIMRVTRETNDRENDLQAGLGDYLGNIITVVTLRLNQQTATRVRERIAAIWPPFRRGVIFNERKWFTIGVLTSVMYGSLVIGYVWLNYVPGEAFLVGGLVTLIGYVTQFSGTISTLTNQYNQVIKHRADLAAIEPLYADYERQVAGPPTPTIRRDWTTLRVEGLNFRYGTEGASLHNLNLRLDRGRRLAFIGPSGSGKTTTLYALRGLYPPDEARVIFNGEAPTDGTAQLAAQTTLIPQTPEIFADTLRENLTMGIPRTEEQIKRAIHLCALDDVVRALPSGLDTPLTEGGSNLSGGQRQRISIARGVLAAEASTVLLLDEPTSSLDPAGELLVYERLFEAFPEKTIISTLHRLHLLRLFDHVYYLDQGRILADGTLVELLERLPAFREVYEEQIG